MIRVRECHADRMYRNDEAHSTRLQRARCSRHMLGGGGHAGVPRPMTIAVVFHATASAARMRAYRIWHCAQTWAQMGIDVRVVNGPAVPPGVDLVIPHVDLSLLPPEYRRLLDAPGIVLNRRVVDIRRRSFSRNLVSATTTATTGRSSSRPTTTAAATRSALSSTGCPCPGAYRSSCAAGPGRPAVSLRRDRSPGRVRQQPSCTPGTWSLAVLVHRAAWGL